MHAANDGVTPDGRERRAGTAVQRELPFRTWGGRRRGAGRKPKGERAGVPHVARPQHKGCHPVHVTLRAARRLPSLRREVVFRAIENAIACCHRSSFRVVHFSVQVDHVHLLVEAADKNALSRGASGLSIRTARAVNRVLRRGGRVWGDRYHARALCTPREVRHAIVYVLMNWRKHIRAARGLDPRASGSWFDGWLPRAHAVSLPRTQLGTTSPVATARTWLATKGWRRHGLIDQRERPKNAAGHRCICRSTSTKSTAKSRAEHGAFARTNSFHR
jgi:putative transposase